MTVDRRRHADLRPYHRATPHLDWHPCHPVRWLPRHGDPYCVLEAISQGFVRLLAWDPFYWALTLLLTLLIWLGL